MNVSHRSTLRSLLAGMVMAGMCVSGAAIKLNGLKDFEPLFGRYAPGGDCSREPQIVVNAIGISFEHGGQREQVTNLEFAASFGGNYYEGITQWFMPFRSTHGFPVVLAFNDGERPGVLSVAAHDEGWPGGPPLSPRNRALVEGSPYVRCR